MAECLRISLLDPIPLRRPPNSLFLVVSTSIVTPYRPEIHPVVGSPSFHRLPDRTRHALQLIRSRFIRRIGMDNERKLSGLEERLDLTDRSVLE